VTTLDIATLGAAALTGYVIWRQYLRPIWVNRRQPLYEPRITEPWVNPKVRWPS
jgi:hypothetical protein